MVQSVDSNNFENKLSEKTYAVVDFFAVWCGPCVKLAPTFLRVAEQFSEQCIFLKIDIDQAEDLAARFKVSSIPTLVFFKSGREEFRVVGGLDEQRLAEKVAQLCGRGAK